jgi:thiol-disulfide isomerase/thioredoxin
MNIEIRMMKTFLIFTFLLLTFCTSAQDIKKIKITDLEKTMAESKTPMIVNFWATFCKPCVEEIPYFQQMTKKYGVKLLLVSLDLESYYPVKIRNFAAKNKFTSPIVWLDEFNADYFCPRVDSAWSGAIPASLFINNQTGYRKFFEEQLSKEKLEKEIMAILQRR